MSSSIVESTTTTLTLTTTAIPPIKRVKQSNPPTSASSQHTVNTNSPPASRIFTPYRTLGLVSPTSVPFIAIAKGKTTFQITTSVGRCLQTYDLRRGLALLFVSRPETPRIVTAVAAWGDVVLGAWGGREESEWGEEEPRHEFSGHDIPGHDNPRGNGTLDKKHRNGRESQELNFNADQVGVWIFKRGKKIGELGWSSGKRECVERLLIFGAWIVGCCATRVEVWKTSGYEHYTSLWAGGAARSGDRALSGEISNMPTLLNKILVGRMDGGVELWNVSTNKLIYTIAPPNLECGPVSALQPTPALSLLAIARTNGSISIHDIHHDKELLRLNSKPVQPHSVTTISFRTDGAGAGEDGNHDGVMATAGFASGDITFWDLNRGGRITGTLRSAHNPPIGANHQGGGLTRVEFLPGQAILVSSGHDNALKTWIFDAAPFAPIPRPLHARSGHAAPVTRLAFLPAQSDGAAAAGKWLMSAGRDRSLWAWSLRRDAQSGELSQGSVKRKARLMGIGATGANVDERARVDDLKAPEVTCFACELNRDGGMGGGMSGKVWGNHNGKQDRDQSSMATGWESVITGHKGDKTARTWFWGRKKAGRWAFDTRDGTEVKSVAVSPCGTFALIGSAAGGIDMFNLQSGIHRQRFPAPLNPAQAKKLKMLQASDGEYSAGPRKFNLGEGKHTKAVTGIIVDSLNRTVISCGLDGQIKFWDFHSGLLQHELDWRPMEILAAQYHRPSDLMAFTCSDFGIRVVDIETRKLVRDLRGCSGPITDTAFAPDGRWLVAASKDSLIRVWDLPTGHLIDATRAPDVCTALTFSPTGEFLATAHASSIGIHIWSNRALFAPISTSHIDISMPSSAPLLALPPSSTQPAHNPLEAAFINHDSVLEATDLPPSLSPDQLGERMTTLSLAPRSRWQTLLHLDAIAARNRPIEPPKAPEKAPFFLPSLNGASNPAPLLGSLPDTPDPGLALRRPARLSSAPSRFTELLHALAGRDSPSEKATAAFTAHLASLSPAAADLEIRTLNPRARSGTASATSKANGTIRTIVNEPVAFVAALTQRLRARRDYELVLAWMAVFLRCHADLVAAGGDGNADEDDDADEQEDGVGNTKAPDTAYQNGTTRSQAQAQDPERRNDAGEPLAANGNVQDTKHPEPCAAEEGELRALLRAWRVEVGREADRLGGLVSYCSGVVGFLRSGR